MLVLGVNVVDLVGSGVCRLDIKVGVTFGA